MDDNHLKSQDGFKTSVVNHWNRPTEIKTKFFTIEIMTLHIIYSQWKRDHKLL